MQHLGGGKGGGVGSWGRCAACDGLCGVGSVVPVHGTTCHVKHLSGDRRGHKGSGSPPLPLPTLANSSLPGCLARGHTSRPTLPLRNPTPPHMHPSPGHPHPPTCMACPLVPGWCLKMASSRPASTLYRLRQLPSAKPERPGSAACNQEGGRGGGMRSPGTLGRLQSHSERVCAAVAQRKSQRGWAAQWGQPGEGAGCQRRALLSVEGLGLATCPPLRMS